LAAPLRRCPPDAAIKSISNHETAGSQGHCLTLNSITDISETDRQHAFNAMMTMKKIDVTAIKPARNG
jgi:hypothetical protein